MFLPTRMDTIMARCRLLDYLNVNRMEVRQGSCVSISVLMLVALLTSLSVSTTCLAQTDEPFTSPVHLKKLSVEELMDIEVTSVSRRTEKLSETASAIQVITRDDIERSGATRLPEALRLASNLTVAQVDGGQYAISARGFNSSTGNKLLVLIDGRTVYSPLFAGMFWDIQEVLLEDIERIEVISGPGGTLWGANAVNGVINIITRLAKDSKGLYAEVGAGKESKVIAGLRYGASLSKNLHFRIYGKYLARDESVFSSGEEANNNWNIGQGGFRMGWNASEKDLVTIQSDYYHSEMLINRGNDSTTLTKGGNALARWSHTFTEDSEFKMQVYFDRVHRESKGSFDDVLKTYDLDLTHRFKLTKYNKIVWGAGYRLADDNFVSGSLTFVPQHISLPVYSLFLQDEIEVVPEKFFVTVGSKALHNYYTGFEFQPNVRFAWKLQEKQQLIWAAISRAVRTPSRVDHDFYVSPILEGGPDFVSEELIAYELGYRIQPTEKISVSVATYYNDYDNIRSLEPKNPPAPVPLVIANGQVGRSFGAEFVLNYQPNNWASVRVGYTGLNMEIKPKSWSLDRTFGSTEAADPKHNFFVRASFDIAENINFYPSYRYVSKIETVTSMDVPAYSELDACLSWNVSDRFEISIVGQNLLHDSHAEFGAAGTRREVERNFYGKIVCRL